MTVEELYEQIGGNYAHAQQILRKDKMISKYLLKLRESGVFEGLMEAGETLEPAAMFEKAHAMKGVCANLGLDELADLVGVVTEGYRPGGTRAMTDEDVKATLARIEELYGKTVEGIRAYEASAE